MVSPPSTTTPSGFPLGLFTTPSRSRLGLSIHPAPLSDGKSNFKDGIILPLFPLFTAPLPHFYPPKSKNDVILAYLILILRKILLEK